MKPSSIHFSFVPLICLIFIFSGCSQKTEEQLIQEKLIGDWTSLDTCKNLNSENCRNQLLLSFKKENFRAKITGEPNFTYIQNNTILIKTTTNYDNHYWEKYKIVFCGKKFLKLKPSSKNSKDEVSRILNRPWKGETITLRKCRKRNSIQPDKIVFYASACYGVCPEFYLEITPNRQVKFLGVSHTKKGSYTHTIKQKDYDRLVRRIQQIPLKQVRSDYSRCTADAQVFSTTIFYGEQHRSYISDMCGYTPPELQYVLYYLAALGEDTTHFKKNNHVFHYSDFDFADFKPQPVEMLSFPK